MRQPHAHADALRAGRAAGHGAGQAGHLHRDAGRLWWDAAAVSANDLAAGRRVRQSQSADDPGQLPHQAVLSAARPGDSRARDARYSAPSCASCAPTATSRGSGGLNLGSSTHTRDAAIVTCRGTSGRNRRYAPIGAGRPAGRSGDRAGAGATQVRVLAERLNPIPLLPDLPAPPALRRRPPAPPRPQPAVAPTTDDAPTAPPSEPPRRGDDGARILSAHTQYRRHPMNPHTPTLRHGTS